MSRGVIIHIDSSEINKVTSGGRRWDSMKGYYACMWACGKGTYGKITKDWDMVTCKNCVKWFKDFKKQVLRGEKK